jgi:hypothetical protein
MLNHRSNERGTASGSPAARPQCPICARSRKERFRALLLNKYDVCYLYCESCGLLQTEQPYWLEEAYGKAIADSDTGLVSRNLDLSKRLSALLYFCFDRQAPYLEYAGGYGLLTRLLRDQGFDFYWHDPYCKNIFARGFEWDPVKGTAGAVTAFEVIEHVWNPAEFIANALSQAHTKTIIFSTVLYKDEPPLPQDWWYYSLSTGQHISFYRRETLVILADKLGLRLYSNGSFHVMTALRLNPIAVRLCSGRFASVANNYVRRRMTPKTVDDHERISRQIGRDVS